ncbi:MAG: hypothetical protein V1773_18340 [bacterium]
MKNKIVITFLLSFVAFLSFTQIKAQGSDLEITKNFKSAVQTLEADIDKAQSVTEIPDFESQTAALKDKYIAKKTLLDKALYPETFESTFEKINKKIEVAKGKLGQIGELQVEVTDLKGKLEELKEFVNKLSEDYYTTLREVVSLRESNKKDKKTVDSLKSLLSKLRENSKKRNSLIDELANSLFFDKEHNVESMNDAEKKELYVKFKSSNMLDNIKRLISDNIKFMESSAFTTPQLDELKQEQNEFRSRWSAIGPKIAQVYASPKEKDAELAAVDGMLRKWDSTINENIWQNVDVQFRIKDITLERFYDGESFYTAVNNYIDKQMKNVEQKNSEELFAAYNTFADSVWNANIAEVWIPLLTRYKMLSNDQISDIDNKLDKWHESLGEPMPNWIYVLVIGVLVLVIIVLIVMVVGKSKKINQIKNT